MSSWQSGAATRVYSSDFDKDFAELPARIQRLIESKLHEMSLRLADYPHYRLTASTDCRFRVGDFRVIYNFNAAKNVIYVFAVGRRDSIYKKR